MRIRALLAPLVILSLVTSACSGSDEEGVQGPDREGMEDGIVVRMDGESVDGYVQRLYEAAQKEGGAVFYTPAQEREVEALRKYWKETFPKVKLEVTAGGTDQILQRALVEGQSGKTKADAMQVSVAEATVLADEELVTMYRPANEKFSDPALVDTERPWSTAYYLTFHVAYNTSRVDPKELPSDFQGFTESRWKGKIAIDLNAVEWVAGLIAKFGEANAIKLLQGLVANDLRLVEGTTLRTEQLAAGQFDVMLDGYGHSLKRFVDEGAPIAVADPQPEPVTQVLAGAVVFEDAPHPNAARLISEFLLMEEGQKVYTDQSKAGARTEGKETSNPYEVFFGGVKPTPLGPDVDFKRATEVLEQFAVRGR